MRIKALGAKLALLAFCAPHCAAGAVADHADANRVIAAMREGLNACVTDKTPAARQGGAARTAIAAAGFAEVQQDAEQHRWAWSVSDLAHADQGFVLVDISTTFPCTVVIGGAAITPDQVVQAAGRWSLEHALSASRSSDPAVSIWTKPFPESGSPNRVLQVRAAPLAPGVTEISVQVPYADGVMTR